MKKLSTHGERVLPSDEISFESAEFAISRYVFASRFVKDKIVLDIACGGGYGTHYLMVKAAKIVMGGDISREAIENARIHYQGEGPQFLFIDGQCLPFQDSSLDVIVSFETIEHLEKYADFLDECKRTLKDDGIFILSTPNKGVANPNPEKLASLSHIQEFSIRELGELLYQRFRKVSWYGHGYWKKGERTEARLLWALRTKLSSVPIVERVGLSIAGVVFRKYRRIRICEIRDFDSIGTTIIFPLESACPTPRHIIAVSSGKRS